MKLRALTLALSSVGLFACGGGSSDSTSTTPTPTPAAPAGITLTGVVAKGAALAGATVTAKCATGTGTATAGADGTYTFTITGGALPCMLSAVAADNSLTLHSVAPAGASTSATANITTLTELLVAQVLGAEPAAFFADSASVATLSTAVTTAKVDAGQTAVINTLKAAGVDTSAITSLVSQPLVAAAGSTAGNAYDKVLDTLAATLTSTGTTLATLTTTVAQTAAGASGSTSTTTTANSSAATLPADLLLKTKAANCDSLRSTTYRAVKFAPIANNPDAAARDPIAVTNTMTFDAATLRATWSGESTYEQWTAHPTEKCRFNDSDGNDILVSKAGVIVGRSSGGENGQTVVRASMGFPVQAFTLADLAGKWNLLEWGPDGQPGFGVVAGTVDIDATGAAVAGRCFDDPISTPEASCVDVFTASTVSLPKFTVNAAGGFTLASTDPKNVWTDRVFAYRPGSGDLLLVSVGSSGGFTFWNKHRTVGPAVAGAESSSWNVNVNTANASPFAISITKNVNVTVNGNTITRNSTAVGQTPDNTHLQTLERNSPRPGYFRRLAEAAAVTVSGGTTPVREFYGLILRGAGLTPVYLPNTSTTSTSNAQMVLSVDR